jgi:hypothetical protein
MPEMHRRGHVRGGDRLRHERVHTGPSVWAVCPGDVPIDSRRSTDRHSRRVLHRRGTLRD